MSASNQHSERRADALDLARELVKEIPPGELFGSGLLLLSSELLSLYEQFETLREMVNELGAYFDFDSLHPDLQDRLSNAMEGTSNPASEPESDLDSSEAGGGEVNCHLCGEPIDNPRNAYQRVTGWEKPDRGVGGKSGSSLVLRQHVAEFAHGVCIAELRANVVHGQEAFDGLQEVTGIDPYSYPRGVLLEALRRAARGVAAPRRNQETRGE